MKRRKRTSKYISHEADRWLEARMKNEPPPDPRIPLKSIVNGRMAAEIVSENYYIGKLLFDAGQATITDLNQYEATVAVCEFERLLTFMVNIHVERAGVVANCNCPSGTYDKKIACSHSLAAGFAVLSKLGYDPTNTWEHSMGHIVAMEAPKAAPSQQTQALVFSLSKAYAGKWTITPLGIPIEKLNGVDLSSPEEITRAIVSNGLGHSTKSVPKNTEPERFVNIGDTGGVVTRLISLSESSNYYAYQFNLDIGTLIPAMRHFPFFLSKNGNPLGERLAISNVPAAALVNIKEIPLPAQFAEPALKAGVVPDMLLAPLIALDEESFNPGDETPIICQTPPWILIRGQLHPLKDASPMFIALAAKGGIRISGTGRDRFIEHYAAAIAGHTRIESDCLSVRNIEGRPIPHLYLTDQSGDLIVNFRVSYGDDFELAYDKKAPEYAIKHNRGNNEFVRLRRDLEAETEYWTGVSKFGLKRGGLPDYFLLKANVHPIDFLIHQVPRLAEAGYVVFGDEDLKSVRVNRNKPQISFSVSSQIDWFDLKAVIDFGGATASFADLRSAVRKKERYVKLTDGSIGHIPEEWLKQYRVLFSLGVDAGESLRISEKQLMVVEDAITLADGAQVDKEFERKLERFRGFSNIAHSGLPAGLTGELRPYQKAGYDWLHFLHDYDFGGILADDMGIGKTVQALAFLLSLRESGHTKAANLIVVPRSILFNWEREAAKFTPGLRILMHSENHRAKEGEFDGYDLVLTTYGVMLRDVDILCKYRFHYVILDESQAIKNPVSVTGVASRRLVCDHRLTLTGTPVENGTIELWSQFAFVNAGLLGNMETFRREFAMSIEKGGDETTANLLRRMVFPFILRRTKDQVATDLPPRDERIVIAEMEPAQRKLYNTTRDRYRGELLSTISEEGMQKARMKVLEALLRLRQIANHPALADPEYSGPSAKFELLKETLDTLREEGHKALIFSQFVKMLTLLRNSLDADGIPYAYLDGSTKDRQARVDAFQNDPNIPFFLISLKAGGVGLNLTAADYVIHIDPWWNPAVERQATDRTHRIGQDKPVFVYKMITRATVEEKILELQDRKRKIADQLVATESGFFKSLTPDDIEVLFK